MLCASVSLWAQETMEQDMFESMKDDDKAVVVAVHKDTNSGMGQVGIDRLTLRLRECYPKYDYCEACTTPGAMEETPNLDALFTQLYKDGYTHVLVQSSCITNDIDMQYLRHLVETAQGKFKQMRLGEPLLSDWADYQEVANLAISTNSMPKEVNVLVCQGTGTEVDATYTLLDYALRDKAQDWMLATIDGIPTMDHLIQQLKKQKIKKVHLVPFDAEVNGKIHGEWVKKLQQAGYKVTAEPHSLCEQEEIIRLFEQHARHAEQFRRLTANEQKIIIR